MFPSVPTSQGGVHPGGGSGGGGGGGGGPRDDDDDMPGAPAAGAHCPAGSVDGAGTDFDDLTKRFEALKRR